MPRAARHRARQAAGLTRRLFGFRGARLLQFIPELIGAGHGVDHGVVGVRQPVAEGLRLGLAGGFFFLLTALAFFFNAGFLRAALDLFLVFAADFLRAFLAIGDSLLPAQPGQ